MKAIIRLTNKDDDIIEVVGEDLTIYVNPLTSLLEVIDRAASDRVIFSSTRQCVKCAYIWNGEDLPVCNNMGEIKDGKYDEFGFFNPFSAKYEEKSEDCTSPADWQKVGDKWKKH